jgi:hypothetical protein
MLDVTNSVCPQCTSEFGFQTQFPHVVVTSLTVSTTIETYYSKFFFNIFVTFIIRHFFNLREL